MDQALLFLSNKLDNRVEQLTEKPSGWIQKHFYVPDPRDPVTGDYKRPGPIILAEHQIRLIDEALSKNEEGQFKYSTIIYSAIKKSGKSALSSAVALYMAYHNPSSYVPVVANDGKQSEDRLYGPVVACFRLHDQLGGIFKGVKYTQTGVVLPNYTKLEPINVDAAGEAGSQPVGIFFSEAWGFTTPKKEKLFSELTLPPTLYGRSIEWIESYAGFVGESNILWNLYETGFLNGEPHPDFLDLQGTDGPVVRVNPAARMFTYWDTEGRMIWQQEEGYYCFPLPENKEELEVLTKVGWKPAEEITLEDSLCVRLDNGNIDYQCPTSIFKKAYEGELYRLKNQRIEFEVTPDHQIFAQYIKHSAGYKDIRRSSPKYEYKKAKIAANLYTGFIPTTGNWDHAPMKDIEIEGLIFEGTYFIEFMAWYLSEGHLNGGYVGNKNYVRSVSIAQDKNKNPDKYTRIKNLLEHMQVSYTENINGFRIFHVELARYLQCFGKSHEKYIPRWILEECSKEQLLIFLDAYTLADGTYSGGRQILYTSSDRMSKDLIELVFKCGYRPSYKGEYSSGGNKGIHHIEVIKKQTEFGWTQSGKRKAWEVYKAPSNTVVWCPTVPQGNFYVKVKNNKCFWTGNSHQASRLHPSEFKRLHRNQWATSLDSFVQEEWWTACENEDLPVLEDSSVPVVVGIDMAVTRDCAALVAVTRDPFNPETGVAVRAVKIFNPKQLGGIIDQEKVVRPVIEQWAKQWNVVCWVYDPREMSKLAQDLVRDGVGWFKPFGQTSPRAVADKALHDMVVAKQVAWNHNTTLGNVGYKGGPDDTLFKHITLAGASTKADSYRIEKLTNSTKIDAAVALSQAASLAMELAIFNDELKEERVLLRYARGEISEEQFSKIMRRSHPALQERLKNGRS